MSRRSAAAALLALAAPLALQVVPAVAGRRPVVTTQRLERRAAPDGDSKRGNLRVSAEVPSDPAPAPEAAAGGSIQTYAFVNSRDLSSARHAHHSTVIVKGRAKPSQLSEMQAGAPQTTVINYEQAAALNATEASYAADRGFLATTCDGDLIHPANIPQVTLMDLTNPAALRWRASMISTETATGYDWTYLDTLMSYFRDQHYTGHPCHNGVAVGNEEWRDAGIALIRAVKAETGKPVIANGAGLGSGGGYFRHRANADLVMAAADGVQIEHFGRNNLAKDVAFLQIALERGKSVYAKCKASWATCTEAFRPLAGPNAYLGMP